jgi:hypothetical protein
MNKHSILFIGLDTHKEFNEVAYIEQHRGAQTVHLGRFSSSKVAVKKLVHQFDPKDSGATLPFGLKGLKGLKGSNLDFIHHNLSLSAIHSNPAISWIAEVLS